MENRISVISVDKLFGFLNHKVEIKEEGVTFIHGPNGCGKTTFLKLIASFFEWDIANLHDTNFERMCIEFQDEKKITIEKTLKIKEFENEKIETPNFIFKLFKNNKQVELFEFHRNLKEIRIPPSQLDEYLPFLHQVGARKWIDGRTDELLSYNEIIERYSHRLPFTTRKKRPDWLQSLQENAKLHFVQTQRLLKVNIENIAHRSEQNVTNVIEIYSNEIKDKISKLLAESSAVSQSKDRSFPQRLLSMQSIEALSEEKIRSDYGETEIKIEKLMEAGLIQQEKNLALPSKAFEATEKKVLTLYLQDINEKLAVFDNLLLRIETFLSIITKKLRNKSFKVSQTNGFFIETIQGKKQVLKPTQLSSGEQHEIVLFYELIFKTSDNSFFLIDEPEISLHIDWQRQFLSDISKIANLGQHSFLVATHSPQIIGTRRDLAVSLDGGILND